MSKRLGGDELLQRKRELRLRIGRSRRRIDARLYAVRAHTRRLVSLRTYISRSSFRWMESLTPGFLAWLQSESVQESSRLALHLMRKIFRFVRHMVWNVFKWVLRQMKSHPITPHTTPTDGVAHGRT